MTHFELLFEEREPNNKTFYKLEDNKEKIKFGDVDFITVSAESVMNDSEVEVFIDLSAFDISWVRGEEAIVLGQALIRQGLKAMEKTNSSLCWKVDMDKYLQYLKDDVVRFIIFKSIDPKDKSLFRVFPIWKDLNSTLEFCFDTRIVWSLDNVAHLTNGIPYEILDYDEDESQKLKGMLESEYQNSYAV